MTNSMERLAPYYDAARRESEARRELIPLEDLGQVYARPPLAPALTRTDDVAVIAEHKRRSPSEGDIRPNSTVWRTVQQYRQGGAAALSILTQGEHFGGRIEDIVPASYPPPLPILRKDFISDEYQVHEARSYGASAVLLIVAGLGDSKLKYLHDEARSIGLECLVEVHDQAELERALEIEPAIIGVNNRNLSTLKVDLDTARQLIPMIPDGIVKVAESGYEIRDEDGVFSYDHIRELREMGADAVLMGTALRRENDPAAALSAWLATDCFVRKP